LDTMLLSNTTADVAGVIMGLVLMAFLAAIYFIPLIIAGCREHPNVVPIGIVNLFFGWTLLGWVAMLAWSLSSDQNWVRKPKAKKRAAADYDHETVREYQEWKRKNPSDE